MAPNELQELTPIAEALNAESNEINTTIANLNAKLAKLNIGLEVWLFPDADHYQIGYAKLSSGYVDNENLYHPGEDKWQLGVRYCTDIKWTLDYNAQDDNDGHFESVPGSGYPSDTPLLQASRELRIRALDYMPTMISELKERAEDSLRSIQAAKKLAAEL